MGRVEGGGGGEFHKERNRKEIVCLAGPGASNGANISRGRPCAECDRPHAPKSKHESNRSEERWKPKQEFSSNPSSQPQR
ncbi:hypothetical protein TNIN_217081 [Trichonephila inaurata madagascariensis]|uniref:Uncharacterized protein n=1 Tax=Trichonephila inaurata madagascariensis TaxID=2747483 RepID=A0A8X6YDF2_9ARAC|nr:hypothetical protein TNIN_217081 [Trichonephila inaurata madagascariensis]